MSDSTPRSTSRHGSRLGPPPAPDRRSFLRYSGALGTAAALSGTLAACSAGPESTNETGDGGQGGDSTLTAVIGYGNDGSWDPTQTASAFAMAGNEHIYEGLLGADPISREPYAALATEVPNDLKATTWTFSLRPGAKWHDGKPVTADDVVFVFDRILDPKTQTLAKGFFESWLKEVRKTGATSVELILKFPFPDGAARLSLAKIMPKHVFGEPGAWDEATKGKTVGSGPYRMTAHHPKSNTTFEAFADYNGPRKAAFKKMNWLTIVDAAPRVAKISGAGADAEISDNIPYANIGQLKKGGLTVEGGAGMNNLFLLFNTAHKPFDDVRVRQALHYAIDREKMIEAALRGHGRASTSFLNESNPSYRPAKTVYGYDLAKARKLLKEAGAGKFGVNLMAVNVSWIVDCLPTIKDGWEKLGVEVTLDPQETTAVFTKLDQKKDFQIVAAASNPNQFGLDADLIMRYNYGPRNIWMGYARWAGNPTAKRLFTDMDRATREPEASRKRAMIQDYIDTVAEQAVLYPVVHNELMTAWDPKKISGVQPQPYPGINLLRAKWA
ncbi:ABC transporter substrate-binding protein [Streptomyces alfalfae]|uniref:ABC transporter substrate-binding protein n=1 Tax=Streptomyces alfalfae TaxID=1642299 RepID=A0A1P8TLE6_9ACTN|nr:ABC transporter substrate-binding protein [Streptomyces alfalfae]AYA18828.1 ABC transporter substrate-binding protein [Streptomyces fradiae]APY88418.1 ABC transporter substrate-binding protein [Streptomyces alfalfae]QQC89201.1 ABC transporter substrate-binding protein [Streptomyces alfalfae]QUI31652.1 ABC transporter substrate-binding protein [Streptomyces alfalfae]RXX46043.1 ABC transporter substrate-binding protein [Streptomyces alfalfae]